MIFRGFFSLCRMMLLSLFLGVAAASAAPSAEGLNLPKPMPSRMVHDFVGLISPADQMVLEQKLQVFDRETSTQITVVVVGDLQGLAPADYAQRLHQEWGVGQAKKNNGILILVKPRQEGSKGEVFISVGYGLEGVVPDITAGQIIDYEMLPHFQEGNFYAGLDQGTEVLMQLTRGEFTADEYRKEDKSSALITVIIWAVIIIAFSIFFRRSKGRGSRGSGYWFPGGFGAGSSFGRGSSGGGFGGFGGGSSGGGGAGRSF